ncbi:HK97-gp10 family putative phage morphogenesis protein [Levilactobacillus humaensis]|uniref:HK97-gp10 family putative phage morphogenesis protein n=1 Tax=Levilactobacillus humaensis TaxID=2950375 RepID=UPI0021C376CB|nr:HK97-gp10 family putative phage morphogenesis protein [Levilactobacillus humaensis]
MSDGNGFEDLAEKLSNIHIGETVAISALEEAADFYLEQLIPRIPESVLNKEHARDHIHVKVENNEVNVAFDDKGWYWIFPENGTIYQRATHYARGTFQQNRSRIEEIMTRKIMSKMKG